MAYIRGASLTDKFITISATRLITLSNTVLTLWSAKVMMAFRDSTC